MLLSHGTLKVLYKCRNMQEEHPIKDNPQNKSIEERVRWLEICLARLWDQVWWMNLPLTVKQQYKIEGFTDPIEDFYKV